MLQKGVFYMSKGHLLPCKRASFRMQKSIFHFVIVNTFYKSWICFVKRYMMSLDRATLMGAAK